MATTEINVSIKDQDGLGLLLRNNYGYSQEQIIDAERTIRRQFRSAANFVFSTILQKTPPQTIEVQTSQNTDEELDGKEGIRLASFSLQRSRPDFLTFIIHEKTFRDVLDNNDMTKFKSTVIHEMIHAADYPIVKGILNLKNQIAEENAYDHSDIFSYRNDLKRSQMVLIGILSLFDHYRAEGIAVLGEQLLLKQQDDLSLVSSFIENDEQLRENPDPVDAALRVFCSAFTSILMRAYQRADIQINQLISRERLLDEFTNNLAYHVAPYILLLTLTRLNLIGRELISKALNGLITGDYDTLTDEEAISIIRAALSLTLPDYVQGLMYLGPHIAPIQPFLVLCAEIQKEYEENNIDSFIQLVYHPKTDEAFNNAMNTIMGSFIDEETISSFYHEFTNNELPEELKNSQIKAKITELYTILKNDPDEERKKIAQWTLTYFFDDQDIIHDDIKGLGYVDDLIVIDRALMILGQ